MNKSYVKIPNVSPVAFWDVNLEQIDFEANSLFVMSKVFNFGRWTDILEVLKYYGLERVRQEIVQAAYLKRTALSFLCVILELNEQDFKVYEQRQARRPHWEY